MIVENKYLYTNLNQCRFEWEFVKLGDPWRLLEPQVINFGVVKSLDIDPGSSGILKIDIPEYLYDADILKIKSIDPYGRELYTNTWTLISPETYAQDMLFP